ncbi:MAG TPA: DUF6134 family protein [Alphaproteobacteria bacterium]|nr:DUF6134 family protein [Alphaproteobacteria bacterium]
MHRLWTGFRILALCAWPLIGAGAVWAEALPATLPPSAHPASQGPAGIDPVGLYGAEARYDILRDGEKVGTHALTFRRTPIGLSVESRSDIEVKLLFLSAYSFRYQSTEHWRGGRLAQLYAASNDNGQAQRVEARAEQNRMSYRVAGGAWQTGQPVLPTTHWAMPRPGPATLLNTLTGNLNQVEIQDAGREAVQIGATAVTARRFVYSGDLAIESWYDADGRWIKLRFRAEDGSTIEYLCSTCAGSTDSAGIE